jgi:hypothetical protein
LLVKIQIEILKDVKFQKNIMIKLSKFYNIKIVFK